MNKFKLFPTNGICEIILLSVRYGFTECCQGVVFKAKIDNKNFNNMSNGLKN